MSIGVTQYIPGESVLEFFSRSDTAMYMAKEGGRNQVVVEEPVAKGDPSVTVELLGEDPDAQDAEGMVITAVRHGRRLVPEV